ncbi:TPA: hypothetical protein KSK08_003502 [Clostridioides difficile]|nr:hypothetical protein [Clostridioides difficile]
MSIGPTKLTRSDAVSYIKRGGRLSLFGAMHPTKNNTQGIGRRGSEWLSSKATNAASK